MKADCADQLFGRGSFSLVFRETILLGRRRCKPGKYLVNLSGKRTAQPGASGKSDLYRIDFINDQGVGAEGANR
jgi:hypothetical protein